jgi:UMF1 family MFS transporter
LKCVEVSSSARFRLRDEDAKKESEQCMVTLLGKTMSTSSFAMYTFSAAVLVQAVMLVGFSSFADYGMFCALVSACYQLRAEKTGLLRESTLSLSRITVSKETPVRPPYSLCYPARRWQQAVPFAIDRSLVSNLRVTNLKLTHLGPYRKKSLLAFAYSGSVASCLFIFITPSVFFLAPILVIAGVASLGCSFVLLNAFLPLLVANHHPDDSGPKSNLSSSSFDFELEALNAEDDGTKTMQPDPDRLSRDLERSAQISSKGVGYGYIAAVFVQVLSIMILWLFSKTAIQKRNPSLPIRVILLLVGIWWAALTTPTLLWLRERPGPPLPVQQKNGTPSKFRTFMFYTSFSLRSFWRTLLRAISLRQTLLFLVSWFLLSDAVATISGTAVLFARTELHMGTIAVALLSITSIGSGILGAFVWPRVQKRFNLQPKSVLLCCVAGMEIIPLYGLLGYIPLFRKLGFIGLQQAWEIYPIAVVHGVVMGGISSYARSVYAPLIPEGSEAAFFALYAVTDKGSSAFGPALVGYIVDHAGSIRPAFIFLAVLVVLPAPLLWWLDVEKGREDARGMAEGDERGRGRYERVDEE